MKTTIVKVIVVAILFLIAMLPSAQSQAPIASVGDTAIDREPNLSAASIDSMVKVQEAYVRMKRMETEYLLAQKQLEQLLKQEAIDASRKYRLNAGEKKLGIAGAILLPIGAALAPVGAMYINRANRGWGDPSATYAKGLGLCIGGGAISVTGLSCLIAQAAKTARIRKERVSESLLKQYSAQ